MIACSSRGLQTVRYDALMLSSYLLMRVLLSLWREHTSIPIVLPGSSSAEMDRIFRLDNEYHRLPCLIGAISELSSTFASGPLDL